MDGKACWRDNIVVERLGRSIEYEDVCLLAMKPFRRPSRPYAVSVVNQRHPHRGLGARISDGVYFTALHELRTHHAAPFRLSPQ
jgi:putative transposase